MAERSALYHLMSHYRDNRNAFYNRAMCHLKAGAYSLDLSEPETVDLPEVCAFSRYGLLEEIDYRCSEDLIVMVDIRFGVIPVCTLHKKHIIKEEFSGNQKEPRREGFTEHTPVGFTPSGTPYYFDSGSGHVIAGGYGW